MALRQMIDNLNKARAAYEEQRKLAGRDVAAEIGRVLAENIPPGWVLYWSQYTPYFNDGDACEFGVNDPELRQDDHKFYLRAAIEKYGAPDETRSYESHDYRTNRKVTNSYVVPGFPVIGGYSVDRLKALQSAWSELPEDLMESAFGDHVQVTVRPDGTTAIDDYEHG